MGIFLFVLLSIPGAMVTNWLLRDRTDATHIAIAIAAGGAVGAVVTVTATYLIGAGMDVPLARELVRREDVWRTAFIVMLGGPLATAAAAWKWRPKPRAAGDLRG
jgi:hypothetical protein